MFEDVFIASSCIHTVSYMLILKPFQDVDACAFVLPNVGLPIYFRRGRAFAEGHIDFYSVRFRVPRHDRFRTCSL